MAAIKKFYEPRQDNQDETFVLVGITPPDKSSQATDESLDELERLTISANGKVLDKINVKIKKFSSAYLINKAKIEEIATTAKAFEATGIIFDDEISPAQQRNIETLSGLKILERTQLILDIFALHAKTLEGKYQVELAQMNYLLPRLTGHGIMLSRLAGGIGTRGPGESKLESDRRNIRTHILTLERRIEKIKKQRQTKRKKRLDSDQTTIAIIGYTNAGKSTLLNQITGADTYVADKLFATLDPKMQKSNLPNGQKIIFSDTVGFINKLPHKLVAAFQATLEETKYADIIIILVDASSSQYQTQLDATYQILKELEIEDKPQLLIWNKIDAVDDKSQIEFLLQYKKPSIAISAKNNIGIDRMIYELQKMITSRRSLLKLKLPYNQYDLLASLHKHAKVIKCVYDDDGIFADAYVPSEFLNTFQPYIIA